MTPVNCTVSYMRYLLYIKPLRCIREARIACQVLLTFLPTIAFSMFPHSSHDVIYFASSFGSKPGWSSMETSFSAVHIQAAVRESKSGTAENLLRNSAANSAFNRTDVDGGVVGNGMRSS